MKDFFSRINSNYGKQCSESTWHSKGEDKKEGPCFFCPGQVEPVALQVTQNKYNPASPLCHSNLQSASILWHQNLHWIRINWGKWSWRKTNKKTKLSAGLVASRRPNSRWDSEPFGVSSSESGFTVTRSAASSSAQCLYAAARTLLKPVGVAILPPCDY